MRKISIAGWLAACFAAISVLILAGCGSGGGGSSPPAPAACTASVPSAPFIWSVSPGNAQATVYFLPGSNPATTSNFVVTSTPGNITATVPNTATSAVVTGLTNGTSYTFTVTAVNCAGSSASAPSSAVIPVAPPGTPTSVTAAAGAMVASAAVSFTAPATGGTPSSYTVTSSPGNITATGTTSPITVQGLAAGSYTFTVMAGNAGGTSTASAPSNAVAVAAPTYNGPFSVNSATGADTNSGAAATPFKTITQGLAVAKAVGALCPVPCNVSVAAGSYSAGETFPLKMPNNVNLVGAGSATTTIFGNGNLATPYTLAGSTIAFQSTLVVPSGVTSNVSGFRISGGWDVQVIVDGAVSTMSSNNVDGATASADGMYVVGNATATVNANTISGTCWLNGSLVVAGHATVTARTNTISATDSVFTAPSCKQAVYVSGGGTALSSPVVNLGTSVSAGGNTVTGSATGVGINILNTGNVVNASGNTWHASVQGASVTGTYTVGTTGTNPAALVGGNNYAITSSSNLQF